LFSNSVKFMLKKPIVSPEKNAENNTNIAIIANSLIFFDFLIKTKIYKKQK